MFSCVLLTLGNPLLAQVYHVHKYTESEGLPSSDVRGMVQSEDGRLWFATRNGIVAYDGRTWLHHGPTDGVVGLNQGLMAIDDRHRIWAVYSGSSTYISIFENGSWQKLPEKLEVESVFSLLPLGGQSREALVGTNSGLIHTQDGANRNLEFEGDISPQVYALTRYGNKTYAATEFGLFEINLKSKPELQLVVDSPVSPIRGLAVDPANDQLWVIGRDWFSTFDGRQWTRVDQKFTDSFGSSVSAIVGPDGALYFGTETGLFSYRTNEGINRIGMNNGLVAEGVRDLLFDRDGLLWVSGARGVSKIVGFGFAKYDQQNGLFDNEVSAVLQRSDGTMVLGHNGGLTFFGDEPGDTVKLGSPITCRVLDLAEDSAGNLWIAAHQTGVFRIDSSGQTKYFAMLANWGVQVHSVLVDQNDRVLISTTEGLFRLQGDRFVVHAHHEGMKKTVARKLFLDRNGKLVVGGGRGLYRQDSDGWKRRFTSTDKSISNVFAYLDRSNDRPLVGTAAGLCTLDGDEIVKLDAPRIDRPVYFIVEDQQQRVWIGTDNGVMRWDGQHLRHFSVEHGLAGRETNRAAGKVDRQGRLWIGTVNGLSIYRPQLDSVNNRSPSLNLIRAEAGDVSWLPSKTQSIPFDRDSLTFHYRAISFLDENEIQVRSWMEGLEPDWQSPERPRDWKIQYNFLPPGEYRLHLQAANVNGQWSDVVSSDLIRVNPPFWHTSWFYSLVLIGVTTFTVFSYRFFSQRRYMGRLEREVDDRVSELQQFELRYGVALSCISDGVKTTDIDGVVLFMNPSAEQIVGLPLTDVGRQIFSKMFVWREDSENDVRELMNHLAKGTYWSAERSLEIVMPDGAVRLVEVSASPLRDVKRELLGAVIANRDVTAKTRLQNELVNSQQLASLGTLAGGIAHDFNNLLSVIVWNVTLSRKELSESIRQDANDLVDAAVLQARSLSNQLLTFSKGGAPLLERMYVDKLIRDSISIVTSESNSRCELSLADHLWPVELDVGQFNQVLNNLLINAIQSMPSGGSISISANNDVDQSAESNKRVVAIEIRDTGCGIPPEQIDRVFEPYFTTKTNGSGIGLATAYSIIQKHEGKLTVRSEVGVGSTFSIILPASNRTPGERTASISVSEFISSGLFSWLTMTD